MKLAVVIPAYRVSKQIVEVVQSIGKEVTNIIVVDDCCPEESGKYLQENCSDERLKVIFHEKNQGVGGAMITGYREALKLGVDIIVKLDGDGQMDPEFIPHLTKPIVNNEADYTKGNRFHNFEYIRAMPKMRLFGNGVLSLINKFVTGYWNLMDPTNGFTAISSNFLKKIELNKVNKRYFFESDMLFRLAIHKAIVKDIPLKAKYEDEKSNLSIFKTLFGFPPKYIKRFFKRIFYQYFLWDFNAGTIQLFFGTLLFLFGAVFGIIKWIGSVQMDVPASAGTIMVAALPVILGFQLLLGFLFFDINNQPRR